MQIVFIGPPGAGKGTQCKRLATLLGIQHLSTGELLRDVRGQDSALARWVTQHLNNGHLAPDQLVMRIVGQRLKRPDCGRGCLFDGVPRTILQAQLLDGCLERAGRPLDLVIELRSEPAELTRRLLRRAHIEHRGDDDLQTIRTRLKIYETQTKPVLDFYLQRGLLTTLDAMQAVDGVFAQVRAAVAACPTAPGTIDALDDRPATQECGRRA